MQLVASKLSALAAVLSMAVLAVVASPVQVDLTLRQFERHQIRGTSSNSDAFANVNYLRVMATTNQLPSSMTSRIILNDTGRVVDSMEAPPRTGRNLPIELVSIMLTYIDPRTRDDILTLRACSLVCRAWSTLCIPRLFENVSISSYGFARELSFFHFTAPHLCQHVRIFELKVWNDIPETPEWTPECFGRFKNLHALHLWCSLRDFTTAELWGLPTPLRLGVTTLLASYYLRELEIDWDFGIDDGGLLYMLSFCSTSLKSLTLWRVRTDYQLGDIEEMPGLSAITLEALSNLSMGHVNHLAIDAALVQCPNLKSLTTHIFGDTELPWTLPPYVPSELEELHLLVRYFPPIPYFAESVRLSALQIDMNVSNRSMALLLFSEWIKDCIDALPFPELLGRLTLNIHKRVGWHNFIYPQASDFEILSTSLARLRNSGTLKSIKIDVLITVDQDVPDVDIPCDITTMGEVRNIRDGFVPILGPGVNIELAIDTWGRRMYTNSVLDWMSLGEGGDRFSR
ncbi:hypothetical protein AB1N83_003477 [Pleurotus pulmonarius]